MWDSVYILCYLNSSVTRRTVIQILTALKNYLLQVVMKLIKHCHEVDLANLGIAQGALLGLVTETRLEITHCFPFPSAASDDTFNDDDFQLDMMRRLRYPQRFFAIKSSRGSCPPQTQIPSI